MIVTLESVALFAAAVLGARVALPLLERLSVSRGWTDPHPAAMDLPERKRGQRPAPLAGGLLFVIAASSALALGQLDLGPFELAFCCLAFAVGWLDDRVPSGLGPLAKGSAQALACAPLAAGAWRGALDPDFAATFGTGAMAAMVVFLLAGLALNLVNTWDHADGIAATFATLAFAFAGQPLLSGAGAGLLARQARPGRVGPPYLGDGGSHFLAATIVVVPAAWPFLLVPAADLVRVLLQRLRSGQRPWAGDRRHFGCLLAARGFGPFRSALVQSALLLVPGIWVLLSRSH